MAKVTLRLWEDKRSPSKEAPVYLVIRHGNTRATLATGIALNPKDWNARTSEPRKSAPEYSRIKNYLDELVADAGRIITEIITEGLEPEAALVKRRLEEEMGRHQAQREAPPCFIQLCLELLETYRAHDRVQTYLAYRTAVRKLAAFVAGTDYKEITDEEVAKVHLPFDRVTPAFLRRFHASLSGNSANTQHKNIMTLKSFYRQAMEDGTIPWGPNPFDSLTVRKEEAVKEKISIDEMRRLASLVLDESSLLADVRAWFLFAFYAGGMRFSDVATMERRHLEVRGEEVRSLYRMGKTKGVHGVLLIQEAVDILDRYNWREKKPEERVFPILDGYDLSTPWTVRSAISTRNTLVNKYLRKLAKRAGIDTKLSFHISRHTLAGYLLEQGYDVYTIRDVLGHENVSITEHYLRGFKGKGPDEAMRSIKL